MITKNICLLLAATLFSLTAAYADENPDVTQGAQEYDWQSCINTNKSACINNCQNSDDINCESNCDSTSKDKCQSQGLNPPQSITP